VEPIVAPRAFEKAIEHIVDGIERAHLRPGDRMPGETELSEQLGVSKPTLRQALRILERSGVVRVKRGAGGGIFVASDLVPTDIITNYVVVEANTVIDILAARRIVEGAVTELAALAGDEQDFNGIARANVLMQRNLGDHALVLGADASFHRAVTRACRNRTLERAMMRVGRDVVSISDAYIDGAIDGEKILDVHERQLQAMRARNLSELVRIMDEHFRMLEEGFAHAIGRDWAQIFGGGHHNFVVRLSPPLANL
jgi:GntR family transcriptional repressor for pyruvate dehydrogenase complex